MIRRIIVNIILAFIFFPILMLLQGYFGRYILHNYSGFTGSFWKYTHMLFVDTVPIMSFALLFLILLPYNTILYIYNQKKGKRLNFIFKILLFFIISLIIFLVLGGGWMLTFNLNNSFPFLLLLLLFSFVIVSLHYWLIDEKVEGVKAKMEA